VFFANIFTQLAFLFILLMLTFAEQNFLNFNEYQFISYIFVNHAFDVVSEKSLPHPRSFRFFPVLSCTGLWF